MPLRTENETLDRLLDLREIQKMLEALAALAGTNFALLDHRGQMLASTSGPAAGIRDEASDMTMKFPVIIADAGEQAGNLHVYSNNHPRPGTYELAEALAASLGQMAAHEREANRRAAELTTIYNTSMMLAEARDLSSLLTRTVQLVAEVMQVKGAAIRLIDQERDELRFVAVHGLSQEYLNSAPVSLSGAAIDLAALEKGFEQVPDLSLDPRVHFPEILKAEGIVSILSVPLRYRQRAIGLLRAYASERRLFSTAEIDLIRAVAAQAGAAIANARLAEESAQAEALEKQVLVAADVQHRMIPPHAPAVRHLELASIYVPCYQLAGDLYDFIPLAGERLGVVIADVAGKGVPASLIMATVRAYLRAGSENFDELPALVGRLNQMLCTDNRPGEFVSLFYGIFDGPKRTLDFVRAGHVPPLLLRDGAVVPLEHRGDTVLGVVPDLSFTQHRLDLKAGDRMLLYTDGLDEARNFKDELFGHERVIQSFAQPADSAEAIVQNVIWDMRRFVGIGPRIDDVTVIAVRVLADVASSEGK